MPKSIICVYQDCPLCGDRGKKIKKIAIEKDFDIRKVSFASSEGRELCREAVLEHGIKTMPFFTDGKIFSERIEELGLKPRKSVKKRATKARKNVKKEEDELGN